MSSLYVHVPFCNHICSYCDFAKVFYNENWVDDYLDALQYEIKDKKIDNQFDTIYIGGGTPSSLSLKQMERLFKMLEPLSMRVVEYSIEVNPESMNEEKIDLMISYGINRISIGVQTFNDQILKMIERHHDKRKVIDLIGMMKEKGIDDINIDLMYGLPKQTFEDFKKDIEILDILDVSHVSIYSLILEDNTMLKNVDYQPLDEDEDAEWYDYINERLNEIGFHQYEISNYYKRKPSLHNQVYWHYEDYEGIGLGAHSLKEHVRYENTRSLTQYLNHQYLMNKAYIDKEDELFEKIMMGLRLKEGICIEKIDELYQIHLIERYREVINKYQKINMLEVADGYLRTTSLGMKFLNTILVDFLD